MIKNKKLYELKLKEKRDGVYAISLVDDPAIESNFLLFNKEEPIIFSENEEQKIITGPALIPDKKILRKYKNEFFDVVLNKQTIKDTAVKFFKENNKNTITNFEIESIKFEDVKLKDGSIFRIDETGKVSIINEDGTLTDAKDGDYILEDDSILTVKGGIKIEMKEEIKTEMAETILKDGDYILEDGTKFSIKDSKIIMIEKEIVNEEPIEEFSNVSEIEIELNKEKENFEKIKVDFEAEKNTLLSEISDLKSKILELEKAPAISRTEIVNNNEKSFDDMSITERTIYNIKKMK